MKKRVLCLVLCLIGGLANLGAAPEATGLRIVRSDDQGIVLEFNAPGLRSESVEHEGVRYDQVTIPGLAWTTEVGRPQVPVEGILLGAPTIGARVEILEADGELVNSYRLAPSPALSVQGEGGARYAEPEFALDEAAYARDAFYPGRLAEVRFAGYLRDQAVVHLRVYPLQYNPFTGETRFHRRIRLKVVWQGARATTVRQAGGAAFERLLQDTLFNYTSLNRGRAGGISPESSLGDRRASVAATPWPALKISVTEDGLYELTPADLQSAGLDLTGVDPRSLKISSQWTEIPILVTGQADGRWDPDDRIVFYGRAMRGEFTVENVYWLTYGGTNGLRMATRDGTPGTAPVPIAFQNRLHAEQNGVYWPNVPDGEGQDHYFWQQLRAPASGNYTVRLDNVARLDRTGQVTVTLRGRTDTATDPDHHTRVYLNGSLISDAWWDGTVEYQHQATISQAQLLEGANTVRVESVGDTGALADIVLLNWFEIAYWDTYVAEEDLLAFGGPSAGTFKYEVGGYTADTVEVYDVTRPEGVVRIVGVDTEEVGGGWLARFQDTSGTDTRYVALAPAQRKRPAAIVLDEPSDLRSSTNGADYVVVTHEDFYASAVNLANHRGSQGLRTTVVKVQDVYDEFSGGVFDPRAIRDFVAYAYESWVPPAPLYLVLIGDASLDYKDNLGTGTPNYVPTNLVETPEVGQTPSDNGFVCVSGDDILPDLFLGRIPVRTAADAAAVVNKIIGYDASPAPGDWTRTALFVADDDDPIFESISEELIDLLPGGFVPRRVYVGEYSAPDDPTADIVDLVDQGAVMVNYVGHGNLDHWGVWAGGRIFQTPDVASLSNVGKPPLVTVANCLSGYFAHPLSTWAYSLGEEWLRVGNRGALAVWAPTGLGHPVGHRALIGEFYHQVFEEGNHTIGSATATAKIVNYARYIGWGELVETFVLFGDPASQLNLPSYPTVSGITPNAGMIDTSLTTTISGTHFVQGATAELVRGTESIVASDVQVHSATNLTCRFDLARALTGVWDLRVANPDGLHDTLPDAFTISAQNTIYLPLVVGNAVD